MYLTLLELDSEVRAEGLQLLCRQVVNWTLQQLFSVEELTSQFLKTTSMHMSRISLQDNMRIGPVGLRDSQLRPSSHENVSGQLAVQPVRVQCVARCLLSVYSRNKCTGQDQMEESMLRFDTSTPMPSTSIRMDVRVLLLEPWHGKNYIVVCNISDNRVDCVAPLSTGIIKHSYQ